MIYYDIYYHVITMSRIENTTNHSKEEQLAQIEEKFGCTLNEFNAFLLLQLPTFEFLAFVNATAIGWGNHLLAMAYNSNGNRASFFRPEYGGFLMHRSEEIINPQIKYLADQKDQELVDQLLSKTAKKQ